MAKQRDDWERWAANLIAAGQMEINLGHFVQAEEHFTAVLHVSAGTVGVKYIAGAYIRLGWVCHEQQRYSLANRHLKRGLKTLARQWSWSFPELVTAVNRDPQFAYEDEEIPATLATGLHFLGRTWCEQGMDVENELQIARGLQLLQASQKIDQDRDWPVNIGFDVLRQVLPNYRLGNVREAQRLLDESEEQFGPEHPTKPAHIRFHQGRLIAEEDPRAAEMHYEAARGGFIWPTFYSACLARVHGELAILRLQDDRKDHLEAALRQALMAVALHAYGNSLETLTDAAWRTYVRLRRDSQEFQSRWKNIKEELWKMDKEPFSDLRVLIEAEGPTRGVERIEQALVRAEDAVNGALGYRDRRLPYRDVASAEVRAS